MDRALTHDELSDLLGAYALDAVEADEAAAVASHLAECPRCAAEVAEHREVIGMFANAGVDAPPEIWERIAARIGQAPPTPGRPAPRVVTARSESVPSRRRNRTRVWSVAAAGAVAALVAAVAVLGVQVGHLDGRVGQLAATGQRNGLGSAVRAALVDPAAQRVALSASAPAGSSGPGPQAALLVIEPDGTAFALNTAMPPLPRDRTYQLWAMTGARPVSLGLLGSDPVDVAFTVSPSVPLPRFAVTAEPAGGTAQPTGAALATSAPLSSS